MLIVHPPEADVRDPLRVLSEVELLRGLSPDMLQRLAGRVTERRWEPGQVLVEEGATGDSLIVLVTGAVTVYRTSPGGARAALAHLVAPACLGEVTLLDGGPRSASVEAVEPTDAVELRRADLLDVLKAEPVILDALLVSLAGLVRRLSDQAADHVLLDLGARVAKTLLTLADGETSPPTIRLSQSQLAELAGGSRQSLNQVVRGFAARGFLRSEGRTIVLLDLPGLRRRAGLPPAEA